MHVLQGKSCSGCALFWCILECISECVSAGYQLLGVCSASEATHPFAPLVSGLLLSQVIEADKYAIMRRCSIPARDLRILDPKLTYPSTILGRERAIVVNLEHIKVLDTVHPSALSTLMHFVHLAHCAF